LDGMGVSPCSCCPPLLPRCHPGGRAEGTGPHCWSPTLSCRYQHFQPSPWPLLWPWPEPRTPASWHPRGH
jgi:hypothetical protein